MLALQRLYHWEKATPARVALTQPMGDGTAQDLTWAQIGDQVRRMAAHFKALGSRAGVQSGHPVVELSLVADERLGHLDG